MFLFYPLWVCCSGEASASTMWDNNAWVYFYDNNTEEEPPFLIQDFIHALQPDARFIVMLRDPVERWAVSLSPMLYLDQVNTSNSRQSSDTHTATFVHPSQHFTLQTQTGTFAVYRKQKKTCCHRRSVAFYSVWHHIILLWQLYEVHGELTVKCLWGMRDYFMLLLLIFTLENVWTCSL